MENIPDILKKSEYDQNIEPNFVILIDKYKHKLQIKIKWIILAISIGDYFNECVRTILSDFKTLLYKWKNNAVKYVERSLVEFAESHNMTVFYLSRGVLMSKKSRPNQTALMHKGTKNLLDELEQLTSSKINIIQIELKLDLITQSCKIEKIVKY